MAKIFRDFDLTSFWEDSDYARKSYVEDKPTAALVQEVEQELGFRLPASYVELMNVQNGGIPRNTCFPSDEPTSWAANHVAITGIMGIGRTRLYSLCGSLGSKFMQEEWGYPEIGVCICTCPSAGHDMLMLDYRESGNCGEPRVVHVDQEGDYKITFLANNFETFVRGLVNDSVYDTSAEDLKQDLEKIDGGSFSQLLTKLIAACQDVDFGPIIRRVCRSLAIEKGYFALHADEKSYLLYDIQFYLYAHARKLVTKAVFLKAYPDMIVFGDGEFTTGGYSPSFVTDWLDARLADGSLIASATGHLMFSGAFLNRLNERLADYR